MRGRGLFQGGNANICNKASQNGLVSMKMMQIISYGLPSQVFIVPPTTKT